jgi:hypothetical protein
MFGIPNADSLSTSHFPIPLKTISHNSTDGTKNTYPRLRAGGLSHLFQADNQGKPSTEEEDKAPQQQTVLIGCCRSEGLQTIQYPN